MATAERGAGCCKCLIAFSFVFLCFDASFFALFGIHSHFPRSFESFLPRSRPHLSFLSAGFAPFPLARSLARFLHIFLYSYAPSAGARACNLSASALGRYRNLHISAIPERTALALFIVRQRLGSRESRRCFLLSCVLHVARCTRRGFADSQFRALNFLLRVTI